MLQFVLNHYDSYVSLLLGVALVLTYLAVRDRYADIVPSSKDNRDG